MVLYALLRLITGVALRWFYRDVSVRHAERVPHGPTPLLVVVNHPNALVDALVVGWTLPRRIRITAKATLFENGLLAWFLHAVGVVPLRRASDERQRAGSPDRARNTDAFRAIVLTLERGGAVLIFPEGKSHDEPTLAPLRTGPARIALQAHDEGRAQGLAILPVGLVFERKESPRSRVLVDVGEPISVAAWTASSRVTSAEALTEEIDRRLRVVTLNYPSADDAARVRRLAAIFASLLDESPAIDRLRSLDAEVEIERRVEHARGLLEREGTDATLRARVDRFLARLDGFEHMLRNERIGVDDVAISLRRRHGARFIVREGGVLAVAGPIALWGRINHWLPFRLARSLGERDMTSRDQPAMRTILAGLVLVVAFYALATAFIARLAGGAVATVYLLSLPLAADVDLRFSQRMHRARQRMRAYLRFRRAPTLRERLTAEHRWLTTELGALADALETSPQNAG